ncbi:MAG: hypothetical protein IPH94_21830 [Saprospiraceae bacterium]|nr:hypothetical protein [Saprospiraceae bacterium]
MTGPVDNVFHYQLYGSEQWRIDKKLSLFGMASRQKKISPVTRSITLVGIELQDGTASAVTISNNTLDIGAGDNGLGINGLNTIVGSNLISNNMISGGGRFGIEIKNPAGGVTVSGNTVNMVSASTDTRDRAAIAILRRSVLAGNVDVPNGVTITGNRRVGWTRSSTSEGLVLW